MKSRCIALVACSLLLTGAAAAMAQANADSLAVVTTLHNYAAAVESKDLAQVEKYVVTNDAFTMFEGGHINWGWADYRDHHLGPELERFLSIQYAYQDIRAHVMGDMAYATLKYRIAIKMAEREGEGEGLATAILTREGGSWKIRHMHTSRIPRRGG